MVVWIKCKRKTRLPRQEFQEAKWTYQISMLGASLPSTTPHLQIVKAPGSSAPHGGGQRRTSELWWLLILGG